MKFNEEQQIFIDALINKRVAQVRTAAEAKAAETVAIAETHPEIKKQLAEAYSKLRIAEIKAAAASLGAVNPSQVATLLDSSVKVDDAGKVLVITPETGEARYSRDGTPLPLNEAVATFLTANPHLVKASITTGAGSKKADAFWGIFQNK